MFSKIFRLLIIIFFLIALIFLIFTSINYNIRINYWGSEMLDKGFWIHPNNQKISNFNFLQSNSGTVVDVLLVEDKVQIGLYDQVSKTLTKVSMKVDSKKILIFNSDGNELKFTNSLDLRNTLLKSSFIVYESKSDLQKNIFYEKLTIIL